LSWFLTYLHALPKLEDGQEGDESKAGGGTEKKWFEQVETIKQDGFHWKAGSERDTTGIWMWSQPFFRKNANGEQMAVLLVDSQGMFDNETTMKLTSSIFGLSTLLSSYQIYNVDKRIQEDNLQQLALFSEYARTADSGSKTTEGVEKTAADKPFQNMEFLVRDWQHFEDESDYEQMEKEMAEYLEKVISEREAKVRTRVKTANRSASPVLTVNLHHW
jgi:atlastin